MDKFFQFSSKNDIIMINNIGIINWNFRYWAYLCSYLISSQNSLIQLDCKFEMYFTYISDGIKFQSGNRFLAILLRFLTKNAITPV